ncbi:unnamed protein product, partial [Ixodes hexagonus]
TFATFLLASLPVQSDHHLHAATAEAEGKESWSYVNVRKDAHMFWWLLYAHKPGDGYKSAPLIIWLQGGPGASSTGFGNFAEIGPLDVFQRPRNHSWVNFANLLFVDNPVGSGYSYVTNDSAYARNESQIADDLVALLSVFLTKLPEFQAVPLYIFGESYGGKMAATFAFALHKAVSSGRINCQLKGVALGDGWLSPLDSTATWGQYLYTMSMLDKADLLSLNQVVGSIGDALAHGKFTKATQLWTTAEDLVETLTNGVDWYNILAQQSPLYGRGTVSLPKKHPLHRAFQRHVAPLYADSLTTLMNGPIRDKLSVIPANVTWGGQSTGVFEHLQEEFMLPAINTVDRLLNETDIRVVVYGGQLDLIVDALGTLQWLDRLSWPGMTGFREAQKRVLLVDGATAAFHKAYKNLAFFWMLKAGHMVRTL